MIFEQECLLTSLNRQWNRNKLNEYVLNDFDHLK